MATHSSILAQKIPWTEEPGNYSPWGLLELDTTEHVYKKRSFFNSKFKRWATTSGSTNKTPDNLAPASGTNKFVAGFQFLKKVFPGLLFTPQMLLFSAIGDQPPPLMQVRMFAAQQAGNPRWRSKCLEHWLGGSWCLFLWNVRLSLD